MNDFRRPTLGALAMVRDLERGVKPLIDTSALTATRALERSLKPLIDTSALTAMGDLQRSFKPLIDTSALTAMRDVQKLIRLPVSFWSDEVAATVYRVAQSGVDLCDDPARLDLFPWVRNLSARAKRQLAVQVMFFIAAALAVAKAEASDDIASRLLAVFVAVLNLLQLSLLAGELRDRD